MLFAVQECVVLSVRSLQSTISTTRPHEEERGRCLTLSAHADEITGEEVEDKRRKKKNLSVFESPPDDKSNNNSNYSQHYHQDANLLPVAPLEEDKESRM